MENNNTFKTLITGIKDSITTTNKFDYNELLGRGLLLSFLLLLNITTFQPTEAYNSVDGFITVNGIKWAIEIKVRESAEYYSTLFLELSKFNRMVGLIGATTKEGLYINFVGDKMYIYSLRDIANKISSGELNIITKNCNKTTAVNKGKVDKRMIELPKKLALCWQYNKGLWLKIQ